MTIDPDLARLAKLRNLAAAAHVLGHDEVDIGTSDLFMLLDAAEELQRAHEAHAQLLDEEYKLRERVAELTEGLRESARESARQGVRPGLPERGV